MKNLIFKTMQTTVYEVTFLDGRIFRVFCRGKNQQKRFLAVIDETENLRSVKELVNGINTITEFEKLTQ